MTSPETLPRPRATPPPLARTPANHLNIVSTQRNGEVTLHVEGEIDLTTAPMLWARLAHEIPDATTRLVLDFRAVPFIDSTGLRVLVRAYKRLRHAGADLVLRAPSASVRKVLEVTSLSTIFTVEG